MKIESGLISDKGGGDEASAKSSAKSKPGENAGNSDNATNTESRVSVYEEPGKSEKA
jgi:hypothetical protein